jgi:hypothetical protein
MEFKCFKKWDQLPKNSDALFTQAEKDSLFFSRQWFENLVTTALEDEKNLLLVCVVEESHVDESTVLAILPLLTSSNKQWTSFHHLYTSLFTLLLAENNQQEILHCLAKGVSQLPFESLALEPIAEDDKNINKLRQVMESFGLSSTRYARFFNWHHPLQGQAFADYMEARPSKVRNTIARKQRKLEREHDYKIRLHAGSDVQQAMADYHAVYKASWKANEPHETVIKGLVDKFSKPAWLRLAILYIEGQPVASQLWFVVHKKASIFKLAYDEDWKQYSPGSILTKYLMETVIDTDKVEEIDFLTGNDRYKQDWMSERRRRWRVVFTRKSEPVKKKNRLLGFIRKLQER